MTGRVRPATLHDAEAVHGIYAPLVRDTALNFETAVPSVEEMRRRIAATVDRFPYLVYEHQSVVAGFAYASAFRTRSAYQWIAEVSVYVDEPRRRSGVGAALYQTLFARLREQGFRTALAVIALPNPPSVSFHERLGFRPVGVFREAGFKLGHWRDSGWWELRLQELANPPPPPRLPP